MLSRTLIVLLLVSAARSESSGECTSSTVLNVIMRLFSVSDLEELLNKAVTFLQTRIQDDDRPKRPFPGCDEPQHYDDITCGLPIYDGTVSIGTNLICDTGCGAVAAPCKIACDGVDAAICFGADLILCKVGCLGIPSCVQACEEAITDPCVEKLIKECDDGCNSLHDSCHSGCMDELSLHIELDLDRISGVISSLGVLGLDMNCTGNGIFRPLEFNASVDVAMDGLGMDLKIHTRDVGISLTNHIVLEAVKISLGMPVTGTLGCKAGGDLELIVGSDVTINNFDLNADLQLDRALKTISDVICLGLPFCEDFVKDAINSALTSIIVGIVPGAFSRLVPSIFNNILGDLTCRSLFNESSSELTLLV